MDTTRACRLFVKLPKGFAHIRLSCRGFETRRNSVILLPTATREKNITHEENPVSMISGFEDVVKENEPLAPYTRLKLGGVAECFAQPETREQLIGLVKRFSEKEMPIRLLGAGSNTLIRNQGVGGLVISLASPVFPRTHNRRRHRHRRRWCATCRLRFQCSQRRFQRTATFWSASPALSVEPFTTTPVRSVFDIGTWVKSVDVLTRSGEEITYQKDEISFSYRQSSLSDLIVSVGDLRIRSRIARSTD